MKASDICLFAESGKISRQDILQCLLGLNPVDTGVYYSLLKKPCTVKELSKKQHKDRTTVQKSLKKLMSLGLVFRRTEPAKTRGYKYVYEALPISKLQKKLQQNATEWYKSVTKLIKQI